MQVLSLGLPRTGTLSMQKALIKLGYHHTYHALDAPSSPTHWMLWEDAADATWGGCAKSFTREDWDRLLGNCAATTDLPAMFGPQLIEAYPEVRTVLDVLHDAIIRLP